MLSKGDIPPKDQYIAPKPFHEPMSVTARKVRNQGYPKGTDELTNRLEPKAQSNIPGKTHTKRRGRKSPALDQMNSMIHELNHLTHSETSGENITLNNDYTEKDERDEGSKSPNIVNRDEEKSTMHGKDKPMLSRELDKQQHLNETMQKNTESKGKNQMGSVGIPGMVESMGETAKELTQSTQPTFIRSRFNLAQEKVNHLFYDVLESITDFFSTIQFKTGGVTLQERVDELKHPKPGYLEWFWSLW